MINFTDVKSRISYFIENKNIRITDFYKETGISYGILSQKTKISEDNIVKFLTKYKDVNPEWLLTGKGDMLKGALTSMNYPLIMEGITKGASPFYESLPVSAGKSGNIASIKETPSGYLKIPGVSAFAFFPAVGYSMKPEINPGDIIGINAIDKWDKVDPDKTYMIVTHEDQMIKHLRIDVDCDDILWCISPNYKEFPIQKEDIKAIYQIVFVGKLM